jgi:hypothetical protein
MTIKQINNLRPGRLRALTGMSVKALEKVLAVTVPVLERRREQAKRERAAAAAGCRWGRQTQTERGARSAAGGDLSAA